MSWAGVILAAGSGIRMKSSTAKSLHRVCGVPMLTHAVHAAVGARLDPIVTVVQPAHCEQPEIQEAAGESILAVQASQLGTAHATQAARSSIGNATSIFIFYADAPLIRSDTIRSILKNHENTEAILTVATVEDPPVSGFGRVTRGEDGRITGIVEQNDADEETLQIREMNTGWYAIQAEWLWDSLSRIGATNGEQYLTDLIALAVEDGLTVSTVRVLDRMESIGVNDRAHLALAEAGMRDRIRTRWMIDGVTMIDPATVYIDAQAELSPDVTIHPNTHILGETRIASGCEVGPNSVLVDATLGRDSEVVSSHVTDAVIGERVKIGPFSRIRPEVSIEDDAHIGNFAEIKNSKIGSNTRVGHFSYVGDADIGRNVNIGAGTVTVNYDGGKKHRTVVAEGAFIGSGSMLVAPVRIGKWAATGAGAVVTHDVPPAETVVGVPARPLDKSQSAIDPVGVSGPSTSPAPPTPPGELLDG